MTEFSYPFEEVALTIATDKAGKRQAVALITGTATIEAEGRGRETEWGITSIELETPVGPADKYSNATIESGHPLFEFAVESIKWAHGDQIFDEALEAQRPDPDAARDRALEKRSQCR